MPTSKKETTAAAGSGPWWVQNATGAQFATYRLVEGLDVVPDESPFDRNGNLRRAIPATVNEPAKAAAKEGDSK